MKVTEITLNTAKDWLRVDYNDDDELIEMMITAAKGHMETYLNQKFSDFEELPNEFTITCLSLINSYYDNRSILPEEKAKQQINLIYGDILDPHRHWQVGASDET